MGLVHLVDVYASTTDRDRMGSQARAMFGQNIQSTEMAAFEQLCAVHRVLRVHQQALIAMARVGTPRVSKTAIAMEKNS